MALGADAAAAAERGAADAAAWGAGVWAVRGAALGADAAAVELGAGVLAVQGVALVADGVGLGVQANPFVPFRAQIPCLPHYCRAVHSDS